MNAHELTQYSEYADGTGFPKRRRRLSAVETKLLSEVFTYNQKPNAQVRRDLGQKLNMTPRAVQIWFQNKRAKVKKGTSSPLIEDQDHGNLFTPSKLEKAEEGYTCTLPTPPGSAFLRGPVFGETENLPSYPEISQNFSFWNGNPSDGTLPTGPSSFVGPRSEIIRKRPDFLDFFSNQVSNDETTVLSPIKCTTNDEHLYTKNEKDDSLMVNFLHPISTGPRFLTPDLMVGSSNFDSYNIFHDSPDRNLFQS